MFDCENCDFHSGCVLMLLLRVVVKPLACEMMLCVVVRFEQLLEQHHVMCASGVVEPPLRLHVNLRNHTLPSHVTRDMSQIE